MKRLEGVSKKFSSFVTDKRRSYVYGSVAFAAVFVVIGLAFLFKSFAAGPQLYLSPATGTVQPGSDYTVTMRIDPAGGNVDSLDATVAYDQTKLQFKSIDTSTSAFTLEIVNTGGAGTVHIARAKIGTPVTADSEVVKITFTALTGTSGSSALTLTGNAASAGVYVNPALVGATVTIQGTTVTPTASYTIESSTATPVLNSPFGLKVYVTTNVPMQGGEVVVNLPIGVAYSGTLDTTGTAFNPVTTVSGTTSTLVHLVYVTQSQTLTGKQLVATIPVTATTAGAKQVTMTGARVADLNAVDITPVTANPFNFTVGSALAAPVVTIPGLTQLPATQNITDLKQAFSIVNFDSTATYTTTIAGSNIAMNAANFAMPASQKNGDLQMVVSATKNGSTNSSTYTIRLRSPNVNRVACVELLDLLAVNKGYGAASTELDLNFDGTVSLVDLLTVTGNWGGACV
jgi:hypothetical protein